MRGRERGESGPFVVEPHHRLTIRPSGSVEHLANDTLTAVPGVSVGHASDPAGRSGCTVVLGPFRGAVVVRGLATGSRELGALDPAHLVPRVDAVLLTGGSAFGLAAADGVMAWLSERGRGYETGVTPVPIVPTAVIFDLAEGAPRPDADLGREACAAASDGPVGQGRVGAGAGATVGKLAGPENGSPGGVGSRSVRVGDWTVGALAVVNALGDVRDGSGRIVAGARGVGGGLLDGEALLMERLAKGEMETLVGGAEDEASTTGVGRNTTLAVVATDAPLDPVGMQRVLAVAAGAFARRVTPVHTPFDGDVLFGLSTGGEGSLSSGELMALGVSGRCVLEEAITGAVTAAADTDEAE